jgi:hypothetical protein
MRRDQLEHAIRAACQIIDRPEVVVIGSQAILGTFSEDELPVRATMSGEVDILPIADSSEETVQLAATAGAGSLRCEAVRIARERPELRRRTARGRPRRLRRDRSASSDGSRAIPAGSGVRRRMACLPGIGAPKAWSSPRTPRRLRTREILQAADATRGGHD